MRRWKIGDWYLAMIDNTAEFLTGGSQGGMTRLWIPLDYLVLGELLQRADSSNSRE